MSPPSGLASHEVQVKKDLAKLLYPKRPWVTSHTASDGRPILNVLIVGAGQSGLVAAAALRQERVEGVLVVDESEEDKAGPWLTFARMITLRTPKYLTGPDLGVPSLTIEAWYEAQHGEGSWEKLGLVPKETWAAYLAWYRRVLELSVQWGTKCGPVRWNETERAWEVPLRAAGGEEIRLARRVVLATGIDGSGHWHVPKFIEDAVPEEKRWHTRHPRDFAALRGKRVGVLGAGASAFDNASCALEAGAAEVRLFFRRPKLVNVNPYRWAEFVGFLRHHADLPDAQKWRFIRQILRMGQLPPRDTYLRASKHAAFHLHPASPWTGARMDGEDVVVTTPSGEHRFDAVIVGTGFVTDLAKREELSWVLPHVALWRDRYTPAAGDEDAELGRHPYLGPAFELTEKQPGTAPFLRTLFNYTFGCLPSLGFGGASISGMKYSVPRLVGGITRSFYEEDLEGYFDALVGFSEPEFE